MIILTVNSISGANSEVKYVSVLFLKLIMIVTSHELVARELETGTDKLYFTGKLATGKLPY